MGLSLNPNFFNVATSRALRHTIIITDRSINDSPLSAGHVKEDFKDIEEHSTTLGWPFF